MLRAIQRGARTATIVSSRHTMSSAPAVNQSKLCDEQFENNWSKAKPYSSIPGPTRFQLIRFFWPGGDLFGKPIPEIRKYFRNRYGDIVKLPGLFGKPEVLMTFDPKMHEMVFRTEGNWPIRRALETLDYYRINRRPDVFCGVGGLVSDQGETWANMRKTVGPVMLKPKAVKSYVGVVDQVTREFVSKIHTLRDVKGELPFDFFNELGLWSIESIGLIALDKRLGVLETNRNEEADMIIKAVRDILELCFEYETHPSMWRFYKTKKFRTLMSALDTATDLGIKYVNEAKALMDKMDNGAIQENVANEESVLQKLLRIDRRYATVMVLDMLLAGVDTTASASATLLYHLANNPEKQEILREEIFSILPDITSPLSEEILNHIPYLRACIKESMRLQPLFPSHLRATGQDIILNGYQIPKDSNVTMTIMSTEESYFKEAKTFLPERWLRENADIVDKPSDPSPFAFLPFGFGPRSCIGRRFADMEIEILIIRILREYRIEWHHGPIEYSLSVVSSPCSPLRYRLIRHDAK